MKRSRRAELAGRVASWLSPIATGGAEAGSSESWSLASRTSLVSAGMIFLVLLPVVLLVAASIGRDRVPFLDSQAVELLLRGCLLSLASWILILLAAIRARRTNPEAAWLAHLPIQLYSISNAFNAYMLGIFTNPFAVFALAGGLPVALLAYGARRAWFGALFFVGLIGAATVATQLGAIPYGPLMASAPMVDDRLSVVWVRGFGLVVAVGCAVLMFVSYRMVAEIRAREGEMRAKHAQLFRVHEDLVQARHDLELSRDALERRVRLRTRELRETNERLRAEAAKRSELSADLEALRLVMEDAVEGIAWIGGDGRVEGVNGAYAKMHRVSAESMRGTHWKEWTHCDDRDLVARATARLDADPRQELEFRGLCGDGSGFYGAVVLVGDSRDGGGRHFRFLRDVSRNRELAEQLTQSSKMDAIGRLAGGVAHDFNNQLAAILASADQLAERPEFADGNEDVRELLEWIHTSAQRGACLTRQLLDFARPQSEGLEVIDVNDSLRAVIAILGPVLGTSIRVRAELGSARLPVLGSASRLDASLMNLALNARDAMPEGGEILFLARVEHLVEPDLRFAGFRMLPGSYARIEVEDGGTGIPDETLGKVFEPFFTTKAPGEGSGLGLPLLYNFVSEMGGGVSIESSTGKGTRVTILLPLAPSPPAALADSIGDRRSRVGGSVLVAEDEEIVRRVLVKMLTHDGFEVVGCANGEEVLRECGADRPGFDVVLMDVRMPVLGGIEALRGLRARGSRVPVILMSGNLAGAEVEALADHESLGDFSVLNKPFGGPELAKAIGEAMEGA